MYNTAVEWHIGASHYIMGKWTSVTSNCREGICITSSSQRVLRFELYGALQGMAEMISLCKDELFPRFPLEPSSLCGWVMMEAAGCSFLPECKEEEPCVVLYCRKKWQLCVVKYVSSSAVLHTQTSVLCVCVGSIWKQERSSALCVFQWIRLTR